VWTVVPLLLALVSFRIRPPAPRIREALVDEEWKALAGEEEVVVSAELGQDAEEIDNKRSAQLQWTWIVTAARALGFARSE